MKSNEKRKRVIFRVNDQRCREGMILAFALSGYPVFVSSRVRMSSYEYDVVVDIPEEAIEQVKE